MIPSNMIHPSPRSIVFDLGKVLLDFDYRIAARALATERGPAPEEIMRHFGSGPLLSRYETGLMTTTQFFEETRKITAYAGSKEEFAAAFGDIFTPINPMIDLHDQLRVRGFQTWIFSNTNELAVEHIRSKYPFFANFKGYVLSYEQRSMKPDSAIYGIVEEMTGSRSAEILYIDDRPENIEAGAARGWQVILQETPEKTLSKVQALGLLH
jgi:putative hydrolase of the HAD superfamily